jgi:copper chaperone
MSGLKDLAQKLFSSGESGETRTGEDTSREQGAMTERTLAVGGMSCGHCKAAVEEELGKLDGVEHSDADFEKGTVEVRYDQARVTTEDLRGAVEEAGYTFSA